MRMNDPTEFRGRIRIATLKADSTASEGDLREDERHKDYLQRFGKILSGTPMDKRISLFGDLKTMVKFTTALLRIEGQVNAELYWLRTLGIFCTRKNGKASFGSLSIAMADYHRIRGGGLDVDGIALKIPTYTIMMRILGWVEVVDRENMLMRFNEEFTCEKDKEMFMSGQKLLDSHYAEDPRYFEPNLNLEVAKDMPSLVLASGQRMFNTCFPVAIP